MSDYAITAFKKFFIIISGLVSAALLARYLGPDLRADYAVIMNSVAILVVIFNFGISGSYQSSRREFGYEVIRAFFALSIICCFLVLVIAAFFFNLHRGGVVLLFSAIFLLRTQMQAYGLVESVWGATYSSVLGALGELAVVVVLWLFFPQALLYGLMAILFKNLVISASSMWVIYRSYISNSGGVGFFSGGVASFFGGGYFSIRESLPVFFITMMTIINYKIDVILLDFMGVDKSIVGVFAVGVLVAEYLWIFSDVFKEVQISRTAKGGGAPDVARANRTAIFITILVYFSFLLFGGFFITLFFGVEFSGSFAFSVAMLAANIFMIPCKIIGVYYISIRRTRPYLFAMTISALTNVCLSFWVIPLWGAYGAVASSIFSYLIVGLFIVADFSKYSKMPLRDVVVIRWREVLFMLRAVSWVRRLG